MTAHPRQRDLWIASAVVVLDQAVKAIVRRQIALNESVTVIPGFFDLTRVHNSGTAFGFMNATDFPFKTSPCVCRRRGARGARDVRRSLPVDQWLARTGLALILGGAAGQPDRSRWPKGTSLISWTLYWSGWHFWAFNVADASITVGVALMILDLMGAGSRHVSRAV